MSSGCVLPSGLINMKIAPYGNLSEMPLSVPFSHCRKNFALFSAVEPSNSSIRFGLFNIPVCVLEQKQIFL